MCRWVQQKWTCCSSCTSSALHKSQVGEVLWVQVTVSTRTRLFTVLDWTRKRSVGTAKACHVADSVLRKINMKSGRM